MPEGVYIFKMVWTLFVAANNSSFVHEYSIVYIQYHSPASEICPWGHAIMIHLSCWSVMCVFLRPPSKYRRIFQNTFVF